MAKALVEIVGDSASAVRALDATSAALASTGEAAASAATEVDAFAASLARAQATRAETLLGQSAALKQFSAANLGTTEGAVAGEAAIKRQSQAYKLLGVQAATAGESITKTAGTIGRGLTTYVTAPTAFIGYEAVKQAVDFNQQMLLLKTQAGDASDSIQKLSSEVLKLASSGAPQGPVQLSEGLYHLVSLGLRGAQAMGTLREASLAAGMGMANLEDTSTALGAAVVSGIRGAQNYSQAMATLVGTAGAGNMRFQDLAASIGNVIPSAAAAGISLHEMGAALAVLTDRGMSSEEAATRLRMSLALIQRPSKAAQAALADMGVNADQLGAMIRQPNGLLHVLEVLRSGIDSVGKVRGNRDLLEAFGGARSGIGIQTLVQSLDSSVSSYQGKLQQIVRDQQQFAKNQQAYLESPAYKLHAALAQVEADLVKLGTALTPAVTGLAGAISGIANAFSSLPGPIKESIGVIVGLLAIGGPVALAVSGIGRLIDGIGSAFSRLIPESTAAMTTVGAEADAASAQMNILAASETRVGTAAVAAAGEAEGAFAAIGAAADLALGPVGALVAGLGLVAYELSKSHTRQVVKYGGASGGGVYESGGQYYIDRGGRPVGITKAQAERIAQEHGQGPSTTEAQMRRRDAQQQQDERAYQDSQRRQRFSQRHGGLPLYQLPAVPEKIQLDMAKAQAGYGSLAKAQDEERKWLLGLIRSGRLKGQALVQAYTDLGSLQTKAVSDTKKAQSAFDQNVHNDTLLGKARVDLAQGEYAAAQALLKQDQARLETMLAEAKTAQERSTVLRQLAEVERLRHSKADAFQLSPRLQEQIAKADAEAVLNPVGMLSTQVELAKRARAQALKAIHSHELTMQGLIQAWQVVAQENQVIASATGLANQYHAVSTAALTRGLGLSQTQNMTLRERLAQREAHRGEAPNAPRTGFGNQSAHHPESQQRAHHQTRSSQPQPVHAGGHGGGAAPVPVHIDVKLVGDLKKIISEVQSYERRNSQRAGGRR